MNDFQIPFTNNNAESAQRGIKIKQKQVNLDPKKELKVILNLKALY